MRKKGVKTKVYTQSIEIDLQISTAAQHSSTEAQQHRSTAAQQHSSTAAGKWRFNKQI
jgi:hypothetical protein